MEKEYEFGNELIVRVPFRNIQLHYFSDDRLIKFFSDNKNNEALFLASPVLQKELEKYIQGEITDQKRSKKLLVSLSKYYQRINSRCTPFGLFAACGVTSWKPNSVISNFYRSTRLDMHYTVALAQHLSKLSFIQEHLLFYPNSSIYSTGGKLRYTEYFYISENRTHRLSQVDQSVYLKHIIDEAKKGRTLSELANSISSNEIPYEHARAFIDELVESQLLISDLEPSVSGSEHLQQILKSLGKIAELHDSNELTQIIKQLKEAENSLKNIDETFGNNTSSFERLIQVLEKFDVPFKRNKLFQADLFVETGEKKLTNETDSSKSIQKELFSALNFLNTLNHSEDTDTHLSEFKDAFVKRYEENTIPLLEALDDEKGIGYGKGKFHTGDVNVLLNGLNLNGVRGSQKVQWSNTDQFLFQKLSKATKKGEFVVTFKENEVDHLFQGQRNFPDSFSVMFRKLNGTENPKIQLQSAGGSSAVNFLGRFALGNEDVYNTVKNIAKHEEELNEYTILAEINHLPENRVGNILLRPHLRSFEIPYLSRSTLPRENQISLDDLHIRVKNRKVILWSKKHQKEVLPRLSNAHNFQARSLPIYHFLCDLQTQDKQAGLSFHWGNLHNQFSFLPRAELGNIVLSPATWRLRKSDFKELFENNKETNWETVKKWKEKWRLPDRFYIADGDNELLIHLHESEPLLKDLFLSEIKNRNSVVLKEFLFDLDDPTVTDEKGNGYTNEFIAHLIRKKKEKNDTRSIYDVKTETKIQRNFSTGSQWLYYKLYSGVKTADRILSEVFKNVTKKLMIEGLIDQWFFIRYFDDDYHLRLRFHLISTDHLGDILHFMSQILEDYESDRMVWKIQLDTYHREVERYGKNTMELAEELFFHDSVYTVNFLDTIQGIENEEELRWLYTLVSLDQLLDDFEISQEGKIELLRQLRDSYRSEFNVQKPVKVQIDKKYRKKRKDIEAIMNNPTFPDLDHQIRGLLKKRSEAFKVIASEIKKKRTNVLLNDLIASYAHMHLNRMFRSKQRMVELLIYDFLCRYHVSDKAKREAKRKKAVLQEN